MNELLLLVLCHLNDYFLGNKHTFGFHLLKKENYKPKLLVKPTIPGRRLTFTHVRAKPVTVTTWVWAPNRLLCSVSQRPTVHLRSQPRLKQTHAQNTHNSADVCPAVEYQWKNWYMVLGTWICYLLCRENVLEECVTLTSKASLMIITLALQCFADLLSNTKWIINYFTKGLLQSF